MSAFPAQVADAALPVAIALAILAGVARAVLWARVGDPRWENLARQHLEPLCTWCVVALATFALALVAADEASLRTLAPAAGLAVFVALAHRGPGPRTRDANEVSAPPSAVPAPAEAPVEGLWARSRAPERDPDTSQFARVAGSRKAP